MQVVDDSDKSQGDLIKNEVVEISSPSDIKSCTGVISEKRSSSILGLSKARSSISR